MTAMDDLRHALRDDRLTRGLGDGEAQLLVAWTEEHVESDPPAARSTVTYARAVGRFVALWCYEGDWPAALQLAATARFSFPLPTDFTDPGDLMDGILRFETRLRAVA